MFLNFSKLKQSSPEAASPASEPSSPSSSSPRPHSTLAHATHHTNHDGNGQERAREVQATLTTGTGTHPLTATATRPAPTVHSVLSVAMRDALAGGIPGMAAMTVQVCALMWLRTTVNYQYRYGTPMLTAFKTLYAQGGIRRFYRGIGPALVQGPLCRFGDTAANTGVLSLLESMDSTRHLPIGIKTLAASLSAAGFRILLMPVDSLKTTLQVEGTNAMHVLRVKLAQRGVAALYHGAIAASVATFVGHYPWFATYNFLNGRLPQYRDQPIKKMARNALIGFCSSVVSDTCANSIRVVKTTRQTSAASLSYAAVIRSVVATDGVLGLMGRGLKTKILTNGIQGLMFSVLWRVAQDIYRDQEKKGKRTHADDAPAADTQQHTPRASS